MRQGFVHVFLAVASAVPPAYAIAARKIAQSNGMTIAGHYMTIAANTEKQAYIENLLAEDSRLSGVKRYVSDVDDDPLDKLMQRKHKAHMRMIAKCAAGKKGPCLILEDDATWDSDSLTKAIDAFYSEQGSQWDLGMLGMSNIFRHHSFNNSAMQGFLMHQSMGEFQSVSHNQSASHNQTVRVEGTTSGCQSYVINGADAATRLHQMLSYRGYDPGAGRRCVEGLNLSELATEHISVVSTTRCIAKQKDKIDSGRYEWSLLKGDKEDDNDAFDEDAGEESGAQVSLKTESYPGSGCKCQYHDLVNDVSRYRCRGMCCDGESNTCEKDGSNSTDKNDNFYECICRWVEPTSAPTPEPTPEPTPTPTHPGNTLRCHPMQDRIVMEGVETQEDCINECASMNSCAAANFYWEEKTCYLCPSGFQLRGSGTSEVWIKESRWPEPPSDINEKENATLETLHDYTTIINNATTR